MPTRRHIRANFEARESVAGEFGLGHIARMVNAPASPTPETALKKSCFIIMPITTPDDYAGFCEGDRDHFQHVLDCLFIPAIAAAGFEPTPPSAQGADNIHAQIINSIAASDLVFCDMSSLNPNVFFEFGIRTALNKPICLVKDELTKKVPFDTGIINHHTYSSRMAAWELEDQTAKLTKHVRTSYERNGKENPLWKYFGLKVSSKFEAGESSLEKKLDLLNMEVAAVRERMVTGYPMTPRTIMSKDKLTIRELSSNQRTITEKVVRILVPSATIRWVDNGVNLLMEVSGVPKDLRETMMRLLPTISGAAAAVTGSEEITVCFF